MIESIYNIFNLAIFANLINDKIDHGNNHMLCYMFKVHNVKYLLVYEIESVIWKQFISFTWLHEYKRDLRAFFMLVCQAFI